MTCDMMSTNINLADIKSSMIGHMFSPHQFMGTIFVAIIILLIHKNNKVLELSSLELTLPVYRTLYMSEENVLLKLQQEQTKLLNKVTCVARGISMLSTF